MKIIILIIYSSNFSLLKRIFNSVNKNYQILSKIKSKSENLKSLILRLNPHKFIENIHFFN